MKLSDFEVVKGTDPGWKATLADIQGNRDYELVIRGPQALVKQVIEKSDFEIEIDTSITPENGKERLQELYDKWSSTAKEPYADGGKNFFKKPDETFEEKSSVVMSLRRVRGKGTLFFIVIPGLVIPAKANFFFVSPPAWSCVGSVAPLTGDQDIFLTLNSPFSPVVSASMRGGLAVDTVSHSAWWPFLPVFRVNGFTRGVTNFAVVQV